MIEHIGIYVGDLRKSHEFYKPLLVESLGLEVIFETEQCIAYGKNKKPCFEIYIGKPKSSPLHIAFKCDSQEQVNEFYKKALFLGAQDNGKPGYRDYFPGYYSAFMIDLDGHNLEALY